MRVNFASNSLIPTFCKGSSLRATILATLLLLLKPLVCLAIQDSGNGDTDVLDARLIGIGPAYHEDIHSRDDTVSSNVATNLSTLSYYTYQPIAPSANAANAISFALEQILVTLESTNLDDISSNQLAMIFGNMSVQFAFHEIAAKSSPRTLPTLPSNLKGWMKIMLQDIREKATKGFIGTLLIVLKIFIASNFVMVVVILFEQDRRLAAHLIH